MVAHARAILDIDTAGLVDEDAHEPSAGRCLAVDQLVPHRGQRSFKQLAQLHGATKNPSAKKKWAVEPISLTYRGAILAETESELKGCNATRARLGALAHPGTSPPSFPLYSFWKRHYPFLGSQACLPMRKLRLPRSLVLSRGGSNASSSRAFSSSAILIVCRTRARVRVDPRRRDHRLESEGYPDRDRVQPERPCLSRHGDGAPGDVRLHQRHRAALSALQGQVRHCADHIEGGGGSGRGGSHHVEVAPGRGAQNGPRAKAVSGADSGGPCEGGGDRPGGTSRGQHPGNAGE